VPRGSLRLPQWGSPPLPTRRLRGGVIPSPGGCNRSSLIVADVADAIDRAAHSRKDPAGNLIEPFPPANR
jgi:hypothetical protein